MRFPLSFRVSIAIAVLQGSIYAAEPMQWISPGEIPSATAAGASLVPAFSRDGRFLVFLSHANNLVTNDDRNTSLDIFRKNLDLGDLELLPITTNGVGGARRDANCVSISSNGQRVAFASWATNLLFVGEPSVPAIFVQNVPTRRTERASVGVNGEPLLKMFRSAFSANPFLSDDARYVFYETDATNAVVEQDTNSTWDVCVHDYVMQTNILVSRSAATNGTANGPSRIGTISRTGRFVAIISASTDLVSDGPTNRQDAIYLCDIETRATVWASRHAEDYASAPFACFSPVISDAGRFVAFKTATTNQTRASVLLFDALDGTTTNLAALSSLDSALAISADGQSVIFDEGGQLYRFDTATRVRSLVSFNFASPATAAIGLSKHPVLSPGGRWLAFVSSANDIATGVTNGSFQIFLHDILNLTNRLITRDLTGEASEVDHELATVAVRDDGSVAFDSLDNNMVADDRNAASDVFLLPLDAAQPILISARDSGLPASSAEGFNTITRFSVSSDAQRVGFTRMSRGSAYLKPFVRDLASSSSIMLHVLTNVCSEARISGRDVAVSGDGRYAAFLQVCRSDWQLVREDLFTGERLQVAHFAGTPLQRNTNAGPQINYDGSQIVYHDFANVYLYSAVSNVTQLISENIAKTGPGNRPSFQGVLSPDGRYVLFASLATDLVTPNTQAILNLFLRDLKNRTTRLVSTTDFEYGAYAGDGAFSADAQHIVFTTGGARRAVLYDISNQVRRAICDNCENPNSSADGRGVVYEKRDPVRQVMFRDMQTGVTNLLSKEISGTNGGNANSTAPLITSDGRFVVFVSRATNLVAEPTGGEPNIFVYDRIQNVTWLASAGVTGVPGGRHGSVNPVLGPDGHTVVFESFAGNLVPGDYNEERDLFVLRLGSGDIDGDTLPDDWEVAYFGDLSRNGSQDFDGDGRSDSQEFAAGTDPTNRGSVLRVFTLSFGAEGTRIFWSAVPGKTYRAEYKNDLTSAWQMVPGTVSATSASASLVDASGAEKRFYRVVLVD